MKTTTNNQQRGFTLLEVMFVFLMSSVLMGFAAYSFTEAKNSVHYSAHEVVALMKRVRAKALSSTRAYIIKPASASTIEVSYADTCDDVSTTLESSLTMTFPTGIALDDITWEVCFSSRGLGQSSADIVISDTSESKKVQVALGGAVRVQ